MKVTTPLNTSFVVQLTATEANAIATALTHTRREYLGINERLLIAQLAHAIGSRLSKQPQIIPEAVAV